MQQFPCFGAWRMNFLNPGGNILGKLLFISLSADGNHGSELAPGINVNKGESLKPPRRIL